MSFKLSDFIAAPSQELLDKAKKSDLLDIADHYGLSNIKTSMLKHEIKNIFLREWITHFLNILLSLNISARGLFQEKNI